TRRVRHGHPRQLSASVADAAAGGVRGAGVRARALALAPSRPRPPAVAHARRLPPLEHPVPRRDRLQRARSQPRGMGRAGRRRGGAGDQLPVLRHAQGRPARRARRGRAVRHAVRRLPHDVHRGQSRPRHPARAAAIPRLPRARARAPPGVSGPPGPAPHRPRPSGDVAGGEQPIRSGRRAPALRSGPMSWAIWTTAVPAGGKSPAARPVPSRLAEQGVPVRLLELDAIRKVLTPHPGYTDAEREVVYRSLVFMAGALTEAGVPVIIDATAHRRAWRDLARTSVARFAEG